MLHSKTNYANENRQEVHKMADVNTDVIKEFIDSFSKLSSENQLILLGMLKGMVAANEIKPLDMKGAK
jgi:hypothetical protein